MNEKQVKAPSDTDWQYVDIYVFSNGQHQTPPRKHHLGVPELNNWNVTLKALARAQYETIFSSIDLYTVEGRKVRTPMQLHHGAAYVAVPFRDSFIPAGYNEYLMKASRSREKRKRNLSIVDERAGQADVEHVEREIKIEEQEDTILKEEKEITTTTVIADTANENKLLEPENSVNNNVSKQTETTLPKKSSSILKDGMINPQNQQRRTSMKQRDPVIKKNLKVNTNNVIPTATTVKSKNNNNVIRNKPKTLAKSNKTVDREAGSTIPMELSTIDENMQTDFKSLYKTNSTHEKNVITESSTIGNIIDDKELIVVKYPDSEMTTTILEREKSASVRHTVLSSTGPVASVVTPINENKLYSISKKDGPSLKIANDAAQSVSKAILPNNVDLQSNKTDTQNPITNGDGLPEVNAAEDELNNKQLADSLVTPVDRKDFVSLNLKIEVRKCDGIVTRCCISEKCSQTNLDHDVFVSCSAKQSKNTLYPTTDEQSLKIVLVQCTCCNHHNLNNVLNQTVGNVKLEDKNYVLLLPSPELNENVERTQSENERQSVFYPVKKIYALHVLDTINQYNDPGGTPSKIETISVVEEDKQSVYMPPLESKKVSIACTSSKMLMTSNSKILTNKETQKVDSLISQDVPKPSTDNDTQTDWCAMLLEARRNENGCYTFHLPPLEVLKYYANKLN